MNPFHNHHSFIPVINAWAYDMIRIHGVKKALTHISVKLVTHAVVSNDFDQKNIENIIDIIAPWCFGQHFMTRLCANSCFNKLLNKISNPPPSDKYLYMKKCIEDTLCQGDFQKNQEKFKSDFYLNDFDPDLNFNLCDIFHL